VSRSFHGANKGERLDRKRTQLAENRARRQAHTPPQNPAADGQARMLDHNERAQEESRAARAHTLHVVSSHITAIAPRVAAGHEWRDIAADYDLSVTAMRRAWSELHRRANT
jgi:hypothetical protein